MIKVKVDGIDITVEPGTTVLQACELAGKEIPRFCYHERLSIAGNCRMCLVEIDKSTKPIASCAMPVAEGQIIYTNTPMVQKARKGVMEFLLINHPLDCPICDQGGECDLQDQSMKYGIDKSRYVLNKRSVKEKYMGPLIKTVMTRCIHCTRCIRFAEEIAGVNDLGAINRGENMEITTYLEKTLDSELSANVIDLCPVGALTSKPYAFEARPWELQKTESIDVMDAVGSNIRIDTKGWEVKRILPRINEEVNEEWISDKTRYACDGLLNNRIDTPFIRLNGKLQKASWDVAFDFISENLKKYNLSQSIGIAGDMVDAETMYIFKKFFTEVLRSKFFDFRQKKVFIDLNNLDLNLFGSTISGIEDSDCILMIGTNPRLEAVLVNSRIRKNFLKAKTKIYSIGDSGDLTYPYKIISHNLSVLDDIEKGSHTICEDFKKSKKIAIIIGISAIEGNNGEYVFNKCKKILSKYNSIGNGWNGLNILYRNAADQNGLKLNFYNAEVVSNYIVFDELEKEIPRCIYLLGADEIKIKKKDNFVIYQGSHGGENSEIADVILPGAAFSEKNGTYVNLEGRVQFANQANFPPGLAKVDWKIIKALSEKFENKISIDSEKHLRDNLINDFPYFKKLNFIPGYNFKNIQIKECMFENQKIISNNFNFYFSNIIARSSKTMRECMDAKILLKKTGTDN